MLICFGYVPNYPIAHVQYIRSFLNLLENNCYPKCSLLWQEGSSSQMEGQSISDIRYFLQLGEGKKMHCLKKDLLNGFLSLVSNIEAKDL